MSAEIAVWLFPVVAAFALYLLKRNIDAIDAALAEHKLKCNQIQIEVQNIKNEYLHKNDFREFKVELRAMFDELKNDIKGLRDHS